MTALLRMTAGLILWAVVFALIYALHGVGCAAGWERVTVAGASLHRLFLLSAWLGGTAAGVVLALYLHRTAHDALTDRAAVALAWVGVAATIVCGLPVVAVPGCV